MLYIKKENINALQLYITTLGKWSAKIYLCILTKLPYISDFSHYISERLLLLVAGQRSNSITVI